MVRIGGWLLLCAGLSNNPTLEVHPLKHQDQLVKSYQVSTSTWPYSPDLGRSLPIIPAPKITDDGVTSYVSARPISCSIDYSSANFKTNRSKQIGKNQSLSDALADYSSAKNKVF
jgi:hypothetical protein